MHSLSLVTAILLAAAPESAPPVDLGVTEETRTSLAQIEVTLTGPAEALAKVDEHSFSLALGIHDVERLLVDGSCTVGESAALPPRPTTWMLYFDQPHLTVTGRKRAIQLARDVLAEVVEPGDRMTVLANGDRLVTVQPLTSEIETVRGSLDRLKLDATQVDGRLLAQETNADLLRRAATTRGGGSPNLWGPSRSMALEEEWATRRDWTRLKLAFRRLADVEPTRAVLYFADSISRTAGMQVEFEFERVVREAAAMGIRVYTVEPSLLGAPTYGRRTLQSLASQTGAQAFVNGVTADEVVRGVRKDQECRWLLSFDPEGLPLDKPMEVFLNVSVPGVRVHAPAKFEIQSPARRTTARLLGHFALDEGKPSLLRSGLVPLAWKHGKYTALLQLTAPGMDASAATWDMGASLVATGRVGAETSARTRVTGTGIPVILEATVELEPGAFELAAVARELSTDRVMSLHAEGTWPDPDDGLAQIVPPVVLQPGTAAFARDGETRKSGSLVHGKDDPLDPSRPTAVVALVCRSKKIQGALDVTRVLEGASPVEFPPLALDLGAERCGQVRDMIPPKTLGPGRYHYGITVREGGTVIGMGETSFVVD